MGKRGRKVKKRKRVTVQFIERQHAGKPVECYVICDRLIAAERADLKDVTIGFAWNTSWRPDADGRRTLGRCIKRRDLDRELDKYDFIIQLNKDAWPTFNDQQKERLIFHELEHAQVVTDKDGQLMRDDRGRLVTRIKKHDIEDFKCVMECYGVGEDLAAIAAAGIADAQRPLLAECEKKQAAQSMAAAVAAGEAEHDQANRRKRKRQKKVKDLKK